VDDVFIAGPVVVAYPPRHARDDFVRLEAARGKLRQQSLIFIRECVRFPAEIGLGQLANFRKEKQQGVSGCWPGKPAGVVISLYLL